VIAANVRGARRSCDTRPATTISHMIIIAAAATYRAGSRRYVLRAPDTRQSWSSSYPAGKRQT
jgi:hypothetical protein